MKIYFIGQKGIPAIYGGVERHVEELATRLAREGHDVFVYCRSYYSPKALKEYNGVKLIQLPTIKTKYLDAITHTFLASLDVLRRDADIIHYQAIGPSILLWIPKLLKKKAKVISTFHCDDRQHKKWGFIARKFLGLGAYVSVNWAHKTIGVSKFICNLHSQEFGGELEYIPNGVAESDNLEAKLIKEKYGLEGNDYILAVSRLIQHKGLHHLIKAYLSLGQTAKKLVITGDTSYTDNYFKYLKSLAGDNKNIIFTGNQTGRTLAELYSNAYLFVQPSEAEGLSIALLEAMSYGKAVLASDIEPNKEALGGLGAVFVSKDLDDLQAKLQYLLSNPDKVAAIGENLQARVKSEYNWDNITKSTMSLYESVVAESANELVQPAEVKSV